MVPPVIVVLSCRWRHYVPGRHQPGIYRTALSSAVAASSKTIILPGTWYRLGQQLSASFDGTHTAASASNVRSLRS